MEQDYEVIAATGLQSGHVGLAEAIPELPVLEALPFRSLCFQGDQASQEAELCQLYTGEAPCWMLVQSPGCKL